MNILNFNEWQEAMKIAEEQKQIIDNIDEGVEAEMINEALSSGILKSIFGARFGAKTYGRQKSFSKMASDFYSAYKVDLNSIQDVDFQIIHNPTKSDTKEILKNPEYLAFWLNEDPNFIESYSGKKGSAEPAIILVTKGPNALVSGFSPKSDFSRWKKDPMGFVGASRWEKEQYSWTGEPVTSTSQKAYHEMTDTVYYLHMPTLKEKYSTIGKRTSRLESRKGAIAMMSNKAIKAENAARYKEILANKIDPKSIMNNIQTSMTMVMDLFNKTFSNLDTLSKMSHYEDVGIEIDKGYYKKGLPDVMQQISYLARDYARDYLDYAKTAKSADIISEFIETGKIPKDYKKDVSYHVDAAISSPERAADILERTRNRASEEMQNLVSHKQTANQYLNAIKAFVEKK